VLSFLYILASVVLLGFGAPWSHSPSGQVFLRSALCLSAFCILSFGLGWVPFQIALSRVRVFEV
jgi:hypothetical protein